MMLYFAKYITKKTGMEFLAEKRCIRKVYIVSAIQIDINLSIRCLAHVINLATQALIKAHSKAKHYNPAAPNEHMPDTDEMVRDEVGLIHTIAVKVCQNNNIY
jgi:hypothetical protein